MDRVWKYSAVSITQKEVILFIFRVLDNYKEL